MTDYLIIALLLVAAVGVLRLAASLAAPQARTESGARFTSRGKILRTARRRSLLYWRRGWWKS